MADAAQEARVDLLLGELRLPSMRRTYRKLAHQVAEAGGDYLTYLQVLLDEEVSQRRSRRVQRRLKEAHFPQIKLLSELDGKALPKGVALAQLQELASGAYIEQRENIIALGGSGTGKTHVSIGLGVEACRQGRRVRFYSAMELASQLEEAQEQHQLHRAIKRLQSLDLLVVDELGYLPLTERAAELLFQAFSARHEQGSVIVNSNLPFSDWAQVFKTERLAVAMLDRLTHRAHILEMNGESYRLRDARQRRSPTKKR